MTVLDAGAVVALLVGEPAAVEVAALIRDRRAATSISALNVAEVIDVLVRLMGRTVEEAVEKLEWLAAGGLETVAVEEAVGRAAGALRARRYSRSARPVSLADCVALATAMARGEALATADPPLAAVARAEGCDVVALPDTRGHRPS